MAYDWILLLLIVILFGIVAVQFQRLNHLHRVMEMQLGINDLLQTQLVILDRRSRGLEETVKPPIPVQPVAKVFMSGGKDG